MKYKVTLINKGRSYNKIVSKDGPNKGNQFQVTYFNFTYQSEAGIGTDSASVLSFNPCEVSWDKFRKLPRKIRSEAEDVILEAYENGEYELCKAKGEEA